MEHISKTVAVTMDELINSFTPQTIKDILVEKGAVSEHQLEMGIKSMEEDNNTPVPWAGKRIADSIETINKIYAKYHDVLWVKLSKSFPKYIQNVSNKLDAVNISFDRYKEGKCDWDEIEKAISEYNQAWCDIVRAFPL